MHGVLHSLLEILGRLVDKQWHCFRPDIQLERHAAVDRSWLNAQSDGCKKWIWRLSERLDSCPHADRPLNANSRGLAEFNVDGIIVCQHGLNDLFLHLTIE